MKSLHASTPFFHLISVIAIVALFVPCLPVQHRLVYAAPGSSKLPNLDHRRSMNPLPAKPSGPIPSGLGDWTPNREESTAASGAQMLHTASLGQPSTIGVYRPGNRYFYLRNDNSLGAPDFIVPLGATGDIPVVGDWDGNGTWTIGVFRPINSTFYLSNNNTLGTVDRIVSLGDGPSGDLPIVGDWDGDGTWTIGVFRPSSNTFYLNNGFENGHVDITVSLGGPGDLPIVGDWDGDGTSTIGLFRPGNNYFFLNNNNSQSWHVDVTIPGYGAPSDVPIVGDWDGNGTTTIGVYRSNVAVPTFFLRTTNTAGTPDLIIPFGATGDKPVAGHWAATGSPDNFFTARFDPINRTGVAGEDLFSGNYNWSLPILGLAGRAGLDLGLSLSLNSLVWTKSSSSIGFDPDKGFPSPGFRLGFPSIQQQTYTSQSGANALLIIMPSGRKVELRQVASNLYESADTSWLQLDTSPNPMILRTADGTQLSFQLFNAEYRCTEVKDRNGNYITVNYDASGHITTIIDTLGRTITFVYSNNNLQKITQLWNGAEHKWAQFEYGNLTIQTSFSGLSIVGPQNGSSITVLTKVILDDSSSFSFDYTPYGQVKQLNHKAADNHLLGYAAYDMNTSAGQTDCPRFTKRTDFAENWNSETPVDTLFTFDRGTGFGQVTLPDGTLVKESHASSGFKKGLTTQVRTFSSDNLVTPKKTSIETWTQDNEALAYPQNPRVSETNVTDDAGNLKRVAISYSSLTLPSGTVCKVPSDTREYDAAGTTVLRKTHTDYVTTAAYLNRHIIGLPIAQYLYDSDNQSATPLSNVTIGYDASSSLTSQGEPVHHDSSFGIGFLTRGNVTSVTRWDVTTLGDQTPQSVTSTMGYNTVGGLISTKDPLLHQVTIAYADSFAATGTSLPASTLAYPTIVTDPDSYSSTTQYDYDLGAVRVNTDPKGAVRTASYDAAGRVARVDISNGAYTRFVYPSSLTQVDTYTLIQTAGAELYSTSVFDGAGRVRATASSFPGSTGGYRGQLIVYDVMGRAVQQSNPTETTSAWIPAGDDAAAGWLYSSQTYDWRGRPRVSTNTDQTTREIAYGGCGCAGGEVVTIRDEMNRRERMTHDVLGRLAKTEILNWNQSVYSTTKTTYNARDQVTLVRQYQGTETSTTFQDTLMTYDGHARLLTRKLPVESGPTSFLYYSDDQLHVRTDPRGATATFTYNSRHLATNITYAKPGNAPEPDPAFPNAPQVGFDYDSAGNRLWMTDGQGRVDYVYDTWSRLTSETRLLTDLGSSFALTYQYNLAGELTRVTEPFASVVNYDYDSAGQMTSVTGSGPVSAPVYISQMGYRAWGAPKQVTYGNGKNLSLAYNNRLQVTSFSIPGLIGATLDYYADGRVHTAQASIERKFDRAYTYDHAGRMTNAVSGFEAGMGSTETGPYRQSYGYDAFSNMTLRTGLLWSGLEDGYSTSYVNDRNQAWSYNEAGLADTQETLTATYSSAGLRHRTVSPNRHVGTQIVNMTLDQRYDGDGQLVKETTTLVGPSTTYNLRSSVLGGQVVADITSSGTRRVGYVYANGQLIARQHHPSSGVQWEHRDPMNTRARATSSTGANLGGAEYDPTHSSVGLEDPGPAPGGDGTLPDLLYPKGGDPTDLSGGCMLDFMVVPCSVAMSVVNMEAGVQTDPYATPSTRWNPNSNGGQGVFEVFHAFADGFVGYGQIGARYAGNGVFHTRPALARSGRNRSSGARVPNTVLGPDGEPQDDRDLATGKRYPFGFRLETSVPGNQQHRTGSIKECGKFKVKVTLTKVPRDMIDELQITRFEQADTNEHVFRVLGKPEIQIKNDRLTYRATVQVGNVVALGLNGSQLGGIQVFIQLPTVGTNTTDTTTLRGDEHVFYSREWFGIRDTIRGASETDPFRDCDDEPLK